MFILWIKENLGHINNLGVEEGNPGMHSYAKLAVAMDSAGCTIKGSSPFLI